MLRVSCVSVLIFATSCSKSGPASAPIASTEPQPTASRGVRAASPAAASQAVIREARALAVEHLSETEKIERLIASVRDLAGATFIRNGVEYTGEQAAKHMRDKWEHKSDEIQTADDFIRIAASKSWVSGRSYLIRYADGREVEVAEFLRGRLAEFDSTPATGHPDP